MRYRRSKNYKENLDPFLGDILVERSESLKGKWSEVFGNNNPIYLEIGMGKGQFLRKMAKQNPSINYLGMEKIEPLLLGNCQKIKEENISNIKLLSLNANYIESYFEDGEIDGLYLNFSDPWPKAKNKNKRLTYRNMLKKYKHILKSNAILEFKTDNNDLFEFSLEEMDYFGMNKILISYNLHSEENSSEIVTTEYEEKFVKIGKTINFLKYSF